MLIAISIASNNLLCMHGNEEEEETAMVEWHTGGLRELLYSNKNQMQTTHKKHGCDSTNHKKIDAALCYDMNNYFPSLSPKFSMFT